VVRAVAEAEEARGGARSRAGSTGSFIIRSVRRLLAPATSGVLACAAFVSLSAVRLSAQEPLSRDVVQDEIAAPARLFIPPITELLENAPERLEQSGVPSAATPSQFKRRTDKLAVVGDSFKLLAVEHAGRIAFQEKTRKMLGGPFWSDYVHSVRVPGQWTDTDAWYVNYIGHPIHGAAAGYNWLDHGPDGDVQFGTSKRYWMGRLRAMAWAAAYSIQFEVGPLSEASIGNVGMNPKTAGWVDHVVTPSGAFGLMVAEDALDRFLVEWVEKRTTNAFWRGSLRVAFNPARSLSNAVTGRPPWHREGRPLDWR
jgi:hypothetical protein